MPSEVLVRASTFDLHVLDVHTKWVKYQHQRMENERSNQVAPKAPIIPVSQLKEMIAQARSAR